MAACRWRPRSGTGRWSPRTPRTDSRGARPTRPWRCSRLDREQQVWPILRHRPDPRARSYLIHRLGPLGADPNRVLAQLDMQDDVSIRRALILTLGEFSEQQWPPDGRERSDTAPARSLRQRSRPRDSRGRRLDARAMGAAGRSRADRSRVRHRVTRGRPPMVRQPAGKDPGHHPGTRRVRDRIAPERGRAGGGARRGRRDAAACPHRPCLRHHGSSGHGGRSPRIPQGFLLSQVPSRPSPAVRSTISPGTTRWPTATG